MAENPILKRLNKKRQQQSSGSSIRDEILSFANNEPTKSKSKSTGMDFKSSAQEYANRMTHTDVFSEPIQQPAYRKVNRTDTDYEATRDTLKQSALDNDRRYDRMLQLKKELQKQPKTREAAVSYMQAQEEYNRLKSVDTGKLFDMDKLTENKVPPSVPNLETRLQNLSRIMKQGDTWLKVDRTLGTATQQHYNVDDSTIGGNIREGWMQGQVQDWLSNEYYRKMQGLPNKTEKIEQFIQEHPEMFASYSQKGMDNYLKRATRGISQNAPMWIGGAKEGFGQGVMYGAGTGAVTAIAGNASPLVVVPEEVITVPVATIMGFRFGMSKGMAEYVARQEASQAYMQYLQEGVSPEVAKPLAETVGVLNGAIEVAQVGDIVRSIPGVKDFIQNASKLAVKEAAKRLGRIAVSYGSEVGENVLEEMLQQTNTDVGGEIAKVIYQGKTGEQLKRKSFKDIAGDVLQTGLQAAIEFSLLPMGGVMKDIGGVMLKNDMQKTQAVQTAVKQQKIQETFKKDIHENIPGAIAEIKQNMDTLQENDAVGLVALDTQIDKIMQRTDLSEEDMAQLGTIKSEIKTVLDDVYANAKKVAPEVKFDVPKEREAVISDILSGKVTTDLDEISLEDYRDAQTAGVVDKITKMIQQGKGVSEIGAAIEEKLPKNKRKPEIIAAIVDAVDQMNAEADGEILMQNVKNIQIAMKSMPQNDTALQNAPGSIMESDGVNTQQGSSNKNVGKVGEAQAENNAKSKPQTDTKQTSDKKTELSTEEYKNKVNSTKYVDNLVNNVDKAKVANFKAVETNPIYKQFKDVVEQVQKNPVFNGIEFRFVDKDTKKYYTRSELDAKGYQHYKEGYYETAGEQNGNTDTGRTISFYRRSSKDTIAEELIHDLQMRMDKIDPELQDMISTWETNVHLQAEEIGVHIPKGYETFAQAMVFTEMGYAKENPELAYLFSVPDEIVDRFNVIMGKDLLDALRGESAPVVPKHQRLLNGKIQGFKASKTMSEEEAFSSMLKQRGIKIQDLIKETEDVIKAIEHEHFEYLKSAMTKGVRQGNLVRDDAGTVKGRFGRTSNNDGWYREFYAKHGYAPSNKKLREMTPKHLKEGFDVFSGKVPPNEEYISAVKDLEFFKRVRDSGIASLKKANEGIKVLENGRVVITPEANLTNQLKPVETEAFKKWFKDSKVVDENGNPKIVYSGHSNTALYGTKFDTRKATAGAFFATENPDIASSYANGKIGIKESYEDGLQYRIYSNGKANKKIWQIELTPEQIKIADDIVQEAGYDFHQYIKDNRQYDGQVRRWGITGGLRKLQNIYEFFDSMGDTVWYDNQNADRTDPQFLRQGTSTFEDLMTAIGLKWESYEKSVPGVFPLYLQISNPIDTAKPFPQDLLNALEQASKRERNASQDEINEKHWTKEYPLKNWIKDIKEQQETGEETFWATQVPAKALPIIKMYGYDGIKDTGGKMGGAGHTVWVAFDPGQIKSAIGNKGTWDPDKPDFNLQLKPWTDTLQEISSADTSINASKLPATFNRVEFKPGTTNADIGGGRFDNATEYLSTQGVENIIYDPFNRTPEYNRNAIERIRGGQVDTSTINNVLNVIMEPEARAQVIVNAADAVKNDGTAYFLIYEGDGTGTGKKTSKGWQENRKAVTYVPEIHKFFKNVKTKGNLIVAQQPIKGESYQLKPVDTFYSSLQKALEAKMPNKATPDQIRGIIKSNGIKAEEIKWSGIEQYLYWQDKVDKTELLQYLQDNNLKINEVVKSHNDQASQAPKYDKYIIPGGENYREMLFTLPLKETDNYKSRHWEEQNVLAHTRLQDYNDINGKNILFVEEIQSDWHQEGRRRGYGIQPRKPSYIDPDTEYVVLNDITDIVGEGKTKEDAMENAGLDELPQDYQVWHWTQIIDPNEDIDHGVPDAPFQKTWYEFVIKRLIRYAVDNGYDGIALTTGEQQAEKNDLSQLVNRIEWVRRGENDYDIDFDMPNLVRTHKEIGLSLQKVEEFVGKEIAEKIAQSKDDAGVIEGDGLKMGGSGMKGFYDVMIPAFLKKYLKQWSIDITTIDLGIHGENIQNEYSVIDNDDGTYSVLDVNGEIVDTFDNYDDAVNGSKDSKAYDMKQPGFYLNDEMKQSAVYEGQPLYQLKEADYDVNRRGYYNTLETNPITDEGLRSELGRIAGLYVVKHNENTIQEALNMLFDMGTEAATKWIMGSSPATPEMNVIAQILVKSAMDQKNYDTAIELIDATAKKATDQGQAIQVLSLFGRMTPEGIIRYTRKTYQKLLTDGQVNEVNTMADQLEKDLRDINKKAAEDVDVGKGMKVIAEKTPEEMLASKIKNTLKDKKDKEFDAVKMMVDTLFKVYKESMEIENEKPIDNSLTFIAHAITEREKYRDVWKQAREIVKEMTDEYPEFDSILEPYFDVILTQTFPDSMIEKAVRTGMKDLQIKLQDIVRKHYSEINKTNQTLVQKMVNDAGLSEYEALMLEDYILKTMDKFTAEAKNKVLSRMFKDKVNTEREKKTIAQRIIEISNLGGFKSPTYKNLIAAKLGFPSLTDELINSLDYQAQQIQLMPDGHDKDLATAKMMDTIAAGIPVSFWRKVSTLQTMAQLLNPKTIIRNLVGNTAFQGIDRLSRILQIPLDQFAKHVLRTGIQTKVHIGMTPLKDREGTMVEKFGGYLSDLLLGEGFKEGWDLGLQDALSGVDTSGLSTQYGLPTAKTFRPKEGNIVANFLSGAETAMTIALRVTDRAAFMSAFTESINEQMKIAKVTEATQDMVDIATAYGLYRTFQDANKVSDFFVRMKNTLNVVGSKDFGLGDLILKYPKTPGNLLARAIDYSPLGMISVAYKLFFDTVTDAQGKSVTVYRPVNKWQYQTDITKYTMQKSAVEGIGRAVTGTALIWAGFILAKVGIVAGNGEDDWDVYYMKQLAGLDKYQINVSALKRYIGSAFDPDAAQRQDGDVLMSYDWMQPFATNIAVGADLALNPGTVGFLGTIVSSVEVGSEALANQPLLSGIRKAFGSRNPVEGIADIIQSAPSSFVPTLFSQISQLIDREKKSTYDITWEGTAVKLIQRKVPVWSKSMEPSVDTFGENQKYYDEKTNPLMATLYTFFSPAIVKQYNPSPEAKFVIDLYDQYKDKKTVPTRLDKKIKVEGVDVVLTPAEYTVLQQYAGQEIKRRLSDEVGADTSVLSEKVQIKRIDNIYSEVYNEVKEKIRKMRGIRKKP